MKTIVVMSEHDNVGNAIEEIKENDRITYVIKGKSFELAATGAVPFGFKVAVKPIGKGSDIIKYNEVIGKASQAIRAGECVHIHNVEGKRGRGDLGESA